MRSPAVCLLTVLLITLLFVGCGAAAQEPQTPGETAAPAAAVPGFHAEFLSTGKSDCTVLWMDGLVVLIDTADADDYDAVAELLRSYGVERIDYIILSHYDKDHIGAAPMLLRSFEVGAVLRTQYTEKSSEFNALVRAEEATGTPAVIVTEDYYITTENGWILIDPPDKDYEDDNNNTQLVTVCYNEHSLLFLGDAKKARLEEFLPLARDGYDLIKLPHHGDSNKALLSLLRSVPPIWAVEMISQNEIVESDLLEVLEKYGVTLYCTVDGPVHMTWEGTGFSVTQ